MRKVCFFTGTRAEYGLLKPLMKDVQADNSMQLQLLVSGMHLSPEFGMTYTEIEADGFRINEKVEILLSSDTSVGILKAMGLGIISFGETLSRLRPDIVVILGDRFEALAMAQACMVGRIPIAHLHGGEATYGVMDELIRHSITKMSHLHFTSTEEYRNRVIQLGEHPERVFNVGAIGTEITRNFKFLSREDLETELKLKLDGPFYLVTFHPVSLDETTAKEQFCCLLTALEEVMKNAHTQIKVIFTKANADTDGRIINRLIDSYVTQHPNRSFSFTSMGQKKYLSALRYATAVVGNSSSGIIEAPSLKVPAINIGNRQKGRIKAKSVIDCEPTVSSIKSAIKQADSTQFLEILKNMINPYEKENTVVRIKEEIKSADLKHIMKKEFYDLSI